MKAGGSTQKVDMVKMVEVSALPQAYEHWDKQWATEVGRAEWTAPEEDVRRIVPFLRECGVRRVLDLGCGVGRHALLLASMGFDVAALEMSTNGIQVARRSAEECGTCIEFCLSAMSSLPYRTDSMDYVLAWNVIYHGDLSLLGKTLDEIYRVLRPGGVFQATLLSKRNAYFGVGRELAKDTWVADGKEEKSHPHCYLNAREAMVTLEEAGFKVLTLRHAAHSKPGSYHWHLVARRK
jgi:tellurite methyltransferase